MPMAEFRGWQFLERLEPWGDRRQDLQFGMLMSLTANINRNPSHTAFRPSDFMPSWDVDESTKPDPVVEQWLAFETSYMQQYQTKDSIN